ncbi:MAG: PQQ-binding-like beta-propeller repeat protein, partial [Candidatus Sericytochromatia bacterium]
RVSQLTQLEQGQTAQLEVVALDSDGNLIDPNLLHLDWKADNGSAIQVDENGMVKGLLPVSTANVTVTDLNTQVSDTGQVIVTGPFTGDPALLDKLFFAFANQSLIKAGDSVPFVLIAVDTQGRPIDPAKLGQINWTVSDTTHFKIDANGVVTALTDTSGTARVSATAGGKQALGSVDMLHGSDQGTPPSGNPSQSAPPTGEPSPSVAPTVAPTVSPSIAPTVAPSVSPTPSVSPSATPTPVLTGNPSALARLIISPSVNTFDGKGDSGNFFVQAIDNAGNFIDPASLNLSWSTDKPTIFLVQGSGRDCKVIADDNSGFASLFVTDQASGIKASAELHIGSGGGGGGGGGGGSAPAAVVLTEPVVDDFNFSYAGGSDGRLYAFNSEQDQVWNFRADGAITRNPAAGPNLIENFIAEQVGPGSGNRLFFGTAAGSFYSVFFDAGSQVQGVQDWKVDAGAAVTTAPLVNVDRGVVVFGDADGRLHGYSLTGGQLWDGPVQISDDALLSSPIATRENAFFVATGEGQLCSLDIGSGATNDCIPLSQPSASPGAVVADPAITSFGAVLVPSMDGHLYIAFHDGCADFQGGTDSIDLETPLHNPIAVNDDNIAFVPAGRDLVQVLANDGLTRGWRTPVCSEGSEIVGAPLLTRRNFQIEQIGPDSGQYAYVSCTDGNLYKVDTLFGDIKDSQPIAGDAENLIAGPAVTLQNIQPLQIGPLGSEILVGGPDGKMQAFDTNNEFLQGGNDGPDFWPKFRYDGFNSGVMDRFFCR